MPTAQSGLREHPANPEFFALIMTYERVIPEILLYLKHRGQAIDLPVSIEADLVEGDVSCVRTYHSTWPLTGKHKIRPSILGPVEDLKEPNIIETYMAGIANPDKGAVLALFFQEGYVREPIRRTSSSSAGTVRRAE